MKATQGEAGLSLSDADYVLALIDTTFESVPEVKRHHERMRAIARRLTAEQGGADERAEELCQSIEKAYGHRFDVSNGERVTASRYDMSQHPKIAEALRLIRARAVLTAQPQAEPSTIFWDALKSERLTTPADQVKPEFARFVDTPQKRFLYDWGRRDGAADGYAKALEEFKAAQPQAEPAAPRLFCEGKGGSDYCAHCGKDMGCTGGPTQPCNVLLALHPEAVTAFGCDVAAYCSKGGMPGERCAQWCGSSSCPVSILSTSTAPTEPT